MMRLRGRCGWGCLALLFAFLVSACRSRPTVEPPPTQTPAPPTPAEPTGDPGILFQDDFSEAESGWPVIPGGPTIASYQAPTVYRLEVREPETLFQAARAGAFADFSVQADMFVSQAGSAGEWRHGLTFRQITPDNYYAFFVNPRAGTWQVLKRVLGQWTPLAEGSSAAIESDLQAVNTFRVDAQGPNLTFSLNAEPLVAVVDSEFAAGDLGFVVETLDQALVAVDADSIVVRRFDAASVPAAPTAAPIPATETPIPSETPTPTATVRRSTAAPTANLLTAVPQTATAFAAAAQTLAALATQAPPIQTAAAAASQVPIILTVACGLPGLPVCP